MARFCKAIQVTNRALTKKGKLKGKNKKETKMLRSGCMHHVITKRGKLKPKYFIEDDMCICKMCHKSFPAKLYKGDDVDDIFDNMEELVNQHKFLTVSVNAGNQACDEASSFAIKLPQIKKAYKRVSKLARKQTEIKKKRRKKKYNGSSQYGSWSSR